MLLEKIRNDRNLKVMISLLLMVILILGIAGLITPRLLQPSHLIELVRQSVPLGITAMGQSAVILSGGIDLSVGSIVTMTNILAADMIRGRDNRTLPVILFLLALGILIGGTSGFLIAKTGIPPMVMTFAMSSIVRGGYLLYSGGAPGGRASPLLRFFGTGRLGPIPVSVIIFIILGILVVFWFKKVRTGRSIYYLGNNFQAARYAGVPVQRRLVFTYAFSAAMAVLSGLIFSGYIGVGSFEVGGEAFMLNSVASAVIGGNTFLGIGNMAGAIPGAFIITLINSILRSLGIAVTGQHIMQGVIILVMVVLYSGQVGFTREKKVKKAGG